jgi:hypothetical protein
MAESRPTGSGTAASSIGAAPAGMNAASGKPAFPDQQKLVAVRMNLLKLAVPVPKDGGHKSAE